MLASTHPLSLFAPPFGTLSLASPRPMQSCSASPSFIDWIFDDMVAMESAPGKKSAPEKAARRVVPRSRTTENDDGAVLEIELPGVAKENLSVEVKDRTLSVVGRRMAWMDGSKQDHSAGESESVSGAGSGDEQDKENVRSGMERSTEMRYEAGFCLGRQVDVDRVEVRQFSDGVLVVRLPKREEPKARKVRFAM